MQLDYYRMTGTTGHYYRNVHFRIYFIYTMKLHIQFIVIVFGAVTVFVYLSGFELYSATNPSPYFIQRAASWSASVIEEDKNSKKTTTELHESYRDLEKHKGNGIESALKLNITSQTNQPVTVTSRTIDRSNSHYKPEPTSRKKHVNLYITSAIMQKGRLGNKMFKYASMLGMAEALGRKMFVQPEARLHEKFKIHNLGYNGSYVNWTTIRERNLVSFDPKLMRLPDENVKVYGYLQSFVYFSNITDLVRQEFTFRDDMANAAASIVSDVRAKYRSSLLVGVHVRRGDFLHNKPKKVIKGFGVPQKSYFLKAFDRMRSSFPGRNVKFFVASDDLAWCRDNLVGHDIVIMPPATASVHLAVLSSCDHVIISGGTFGWWGGWLAGGKVIYYKGYMAPGTVLGNLLTPETYYPRLWIGMDD